MTGPRHLKLTLILVALVLALAIVGEARADVTSNTSTTSTSTQSVSGPGPAHSNAPIPSSSDPSPAGSNTAPVPSDPAPVSPDPVPVSTGSPPVSTAPAPTPTPPVTGSAPVSTGPAPGSTSDPAPPDHVPDPPASADQPTTAGGPSTGTNQVLQQVQVSGCLSHCQGTSQTQAAQQQNVTVQGASPGQSPAGPQSQGSANATQIQVGCSHDCSGTSLDTTAQAISPGALSQLLAAVGSHALPGQPPVAAGAQSGVQQTSQQTQQGGSDQFQAASQMSTAVHNLVSEAVAETVQAVNETTQTIVQVQIGCLFYCTDTHQTQQASQSNTAVQVVAQGVADATAPVSTAVNIVNQFVWQLQIGCLAWCSDTTQDQSASQSNGVVVMTLPPASDPPPTTSPGDPGPGPGTGDPGPGSAPTDPAPAPSGPGPAPATPQVVALKPPTAVAVKPPPAVAVAPPTAAAVTAPSGQWVLAAGIDGRRPRSGEASSSAPAARQVVATTIVPVASVASSPTQTHRAAPIAGRISSGSWQIEGFRAAPATIPSSGPVPARGESSAPQAAVAAVAALALGLLLFTAIRLRTR